MKTIAILFAFLIGCVAVSFAADSRYICEGGFCRLKTAAERFPALRSEVRSSCSGVATNAGCSGNRTARTPARTLMSRAAQVRPLRGIVSRFRGCGG